MRHLRLEKRPEEVAVLTIDCPGRSVNTFSSAFFDEVEALMDTLEGDSGLKGAVIMSAKESSFVAGADLVELGRMGDESEITAFLTRGNALLNRLSGWSKPVVCAIHGDCLGGGLELALAADYRVASDDAVTRFAMPEVRLGLVPAAGGTHRLPRLIGLPEALPLMLTGREVRVREAKKLGLVDAVVSRYSLQHAAVQVALKLADGTMPRSGKRRRPLHYRLLDKAALGRSLLLSRAEKQVRKQTRGHYPAPMAILESVRHGYDHGIAEGIRQDIFRFGRVALTPGSRSLATLFFAMNSRKAHAGRARAVPVKKLGILGSGLMGSGIAEVSAELTETLLLKDLTLEAAAKGVREVMKGLEAQSRTGAITAFERDAFCARVLPCTDYKAFKNSDLVVEAAFEDLALKRTLLREVEEATCDRAIFASNTSSIPISAIAEGCRRPENVIGMHYFSPVRRMPLLEIITTDQTADWVTATALDFGIRQKKTCIVVKDGPAFYTTRILSVMLNEVMLLLEEGVSPHILDDAMTRFGYPVGPVALVDAVGIDVGMHVAGVMKAPCAARNIRMSTLLGRLHTRGCLGRKSGKGFYDYTKGRRGGQRRVNSVLSHLVVARPSSRVDREELQNRMGLMLVNEAILCLEEGIIASPEDGDVGAVLGLGFPPFLGGPFRYADAMGAPALLERMESLEIRYGERFSPAGLLRDMAASGGSFYA
ncbi:3-hydroxyacyl-CoA dehydrogenase NAD-binding domain-containing protein [Desulfoluna spongiiphila]|uniref:3-hydroxyacyl-CoA dehydrogenase NAD-binding domain-containing protein n=1 Tax=Desulfoluna spongiiphila TaxID=419481 RepID=UPI00125456AA|nr:3-hydroxyacyl-CoA dehydrogenase NAD-binding domain-containing protein [Desulfoluna spongiiphila]VVS95260.1 enoyl-coa hydratase/isomerase [Desulfoluna spongiiphila]